jgi:hypothetical protein
MVEISKSGATGGERKRIDEVDTAPFLDPSARRAS